MNPLRRPCGVVWHSLSRRFSTWSGLGQFVDGPNQPAWGIIKQTEQQINNTCKRAEEERQKAKPIDWAYWENEIAHKDLVKCLRAHYEQQERVYGHLLSANVLKEKAQQIANKNTNDMSWSLLDNAVASCLAAVKQSEDILNKGAAALWISYHNPPLSALNTNEWLDSDLYWQAFVEKHFFYSQYQPGVADPESPAVCEEARKDWHKRVNKFNDRSDTPLLYNFVDTLPSWEYYDIHRQEGKAFIEHMMYYLIRTGGDYRFFPELVPWQWLGDIEDQRYRFLSVAQRRRSAFQSSSLSREQPLDLLPLDMEHDLDGHLMKHFTAEAAHVSAAVGRLMVSFSFLCDPFIPCSSLRSAITVMKVDNGKGKWYSLGDDVSALFYLPDKLHRKAPSPKAALTRIMDHLTMTGQRLNPAYAAVFESFADILEQRGENWFCSEGECASQAFLRRLRSDDPQREVFEEYFREMYSRFSAAEEVKADEFIKVMQKKENAHKAEAQAYNHWHMANNAEKAKEEAEHIVVLFNNKQLQPLLDSSSVVVFNEEGQKINDPQQLVASFQAFEGLKDTIAEAVKNSKKSGAPQKK
ncbi:hypothetical protein, conserved [Eimeria brunetti]|uniref:Uncharacterized protein n=1 Tax=Eimeria brunetti TaxID=51314 RepID=U6LG61_9EIME|nr:hypothetical protein, conserved [Eimeria brunetti]